MIAKIHKSREGQTFLALCDKDILGKKFEEGKKQLDLTSKFYEGEEKKEKEIKDMIKHVYIINAAGKQTIEFLKKHDLVQEGHIITIDGIPHAQVCVIRE